MNDLISVIVPIYKTEQYLSRCIESIRAQTYSNLEIILIDDGSPDNCPKICDELVEKDFRIKVIHKDNGGMSSARNAGLDIATGSYIGFIDSDDWIEPTMYEELYNIISSKQCDIASCQHQKTTSIIENVYKDQPETIMVFNNVEALRNLYNGKYLDFIVWDKLYKQKLFNNVRFKEGIALEDVEVIPKLFWNADNIGVTDKQLYFYFQRENSIISSGVSKWKCKSSAFVFQRNSDFFKNKNDELYLLAQKAFSDFFINWTLKVYKSDESNKKEYYAVIKSLLLKNISKFLLNPYIKFKHKVLLSLGCVSLENIIIYGILAMQRNK